MAKREVPRDPPSEDLINFVQNVLRGAEQGSALGLIPGNLTPDPSERQPAVQTGASVISALLDPSPAGEAALGVKGFKGAKAARSGMKPTPSQIDEALGELAKQRRMLDRMRNVLRTKAPERFANKLTEAGVKGFNFLRNVLSGRDLTKRAILAGVNSPATGATLGETILELQNRLENESDRPEDR